MSTTLNEKLSPVTVYVPVSKHTGFAKCFQHGGSWFHSTNIEEQERYVFDREGLEGLLSRVWAAAEQRMIAEDKGNSLKGLMPQKPFIQSLFLNK